MPKKADRTVNRESVLSHVPNSQRALFTSQNASGESASFFALLLDKLQVGVAHVDCQGQILYANARFAEMVGQPLRNLCGARFKSFISPRSWPSIDNAFLRAAISPIRGTLSAVTGNLGKHRLGLAFTPLVIGQKTTVQIVAEEITELIETERALEASEASLKTVSSRLIEVQDEERRRLAREIHDTTGQELALTILELDHLAREIADLPGTGAHTIHECTKQLRKAESDLRTLSYILHPPLLDDMGLGVAMGWFLEGFAKRTAIQIESEIPAGIPRFESKMEIALFRVIQEALTNVYRHSGSKWARVRLVLGPLALEAVIEDHGRGLGDRQQTPGLGLQSMKGRMEMVEGSLEIHSNSHGTRIVARIPLHDSQAMASSSPLTPGEIPKRVLIVDDHQVARRGIRTLFDGQNDLQICGEAADGVEAVRQTKELKPDLIILDLTMPNMGGLSAASQIRQSGVATKILVYSSHSLPQLERTVRLAGCDGYVVKSDATRDLLRAARDILRGHKFFHSERAAASKSA